MYQYKKGDSRICSNNRTIALISHASKVRLHESHSAQIGYIHVHEARNGNRTGRFHERKRYTTSNLRRIMERSTEYQRPIYM